MIAPNTTTQDHRMPTTTQRFPRIVRDEDLALTAAREIVACNVPIFPLHTIGANGHCTCTNGPACDRPAKHPRITEYATEATTDRRTLNGWAKRWPGCNWAIPTGARSGIVAPDIDPRNNGDETIHELLRTHGPLPPTPTVATGGGGTQPWFRHPGVHVTTRSHALGAGVDMRGDDGVAIAPGSLHKSGKRYEWLPGLSLSDVPIAPLPTWMLTLMEQIKAESASELEYLRIQSITCNPPALSVSLIHLSDSDKNGPLASIPKALLEQAITATLPDGPGKRHLLIFELARRLKGIPQLADVHPAPLRGIVSQWHALALPHITTKDFLDTWGEFVTAWDRVRIPHGTFLLPEILKRADAADMPTLAIEYDCAHMRRLVKICREMQRTVGAGNNFFLSSYDAAKLLGIDQPTAFRRLAALVADDVLIKAIPGTPGKHGIATRYRFKPDEPTPAERAAPAAAARDAQAREENQRLRDELEKQ